MPPCGHGGESFLNYFISLVYINNDTGVPSFQSSSQTGTQWGSKDLSEGNQWSSVNPW